VQATLRFAILEYSGVAASNALDRVSSAEGTSASPNSGSLTNTTSGDLMLAGFLSVDSETFTPGNGYTAEEASQPIQSADGPVSAGATLGATFGGIAPGRVLAAFHPATSTPFL